MRPTLASSLGPAAQKPAHAYFENEPGRRGAANLLARDGSVAFANIAKLPE